MGNANFSAKDMLVGESPKVKFTAQCDRMGTFPPLDEMKDRPGSLPQSKLGST